MPVAITPVDRQCRAVAVELLLNRLDQCACVPVDGAHAAELLVAFRDVGLRLRRDSQPAEHVVEERQHVVGPLGSAERHHEQRVVFARVRIYGFDCHATLPTKNGPKLSKYCDVCSVLRISCTMADSGCSFGPSRPTMKSLSFLSRPWHASRTSAACPPAP